MKAIIYVGDVLSRLRAMPDESVHCVITSPPYWGLRDYGCEGQIGLEKNPQEFIAKLVEVFREIRRVLRPEGTCWVNMGDSYAGSRSGPQGSSGDMAGRAITASREHWHDHNHGCIASIKAKDLVGMPWRLAFALQEDGWWLRQDIIWAKPNPMPESVTDRCTKAHEYVFLLTKSAKYFYDADAIRTPFSPETKALSFQTMEFSRRDGYANPSAKGSTFTSGKTAALKPTVEQGDRADNPMGANKRSVWEIATEAFPEAHFATFPTKLVEPCILAGTSEKGCCEACGAPWERVTEKAVAFASGSGRSGRVPEGKHAGGTQEASGEYDIRMGPVTSTRTVGWKAGCTCGTGVRPCVVLDPFSGAGTTGLVALRLHREYVGIELKPEYAQMSKRRLQKTDPLFNQVEVVP